MGRSGERILPSFKLRRRTLVCYSSKLQHSPSTIYIVIPANAFVALHLTKPSLLHGKPSLLQITHNAPLHPFIKNTKNHKNHRQEPKIHQNHQESWPSHLTRVQRQKTLPRSFSCKPLRGKRFPLTHNFQ